MKTDGGVARVEVVDARRPKLTESQRCIIKLYAEGHSLSAAAKALGISRTADTKAFRSALKKLTALLP